jgi:hypothetical protein
MFTLIIIVLLAAFTFGVFKYLESRQKKALIIKMTNTTKTVSTHAFLAARDTTSVAYQMGVKTSLMLAEQGDALADEWEKDAERLAKLGGAVKVAKTNHESMCTSIGLGSLGSDLKKENDARAAQLKANREAKARA